MLSIVPRAQVAMRPQDHSGLAERPFGLGLDPRFLYQSSSYGEAFRCVQRALQRREGLAVVTGPAGSGKTLLCRALLQQLETPVCVSVLLDPRVTFEELLRHMLHDFGVAPPAPPTARPELMKALQRFLASLVPMGAYAVLVVDEAHDLDPEVLEQIRLLLNLETDRVKLLQVVLIGQPSLSGLLERPAMHQLAERVACLAALAPLGRGDVRRYVEHRLAVAQELTPLADVVLLKDDDSGAYRVSSNVVFTPSALRQVAELSHGIPRSINLLCDRALDLSYESRRHTIDGRMVRAAARRLALTSAPAAGFGAAGRVAAAAVLALAAAGFGTWTWAGSGEIPPSPAPPSAFAGTGLLVEAVPAVRVPLPLADSFHVRVASFGTLPAAGDLARLLEASGLPAFSREERGVHHVVVGPYLSESEASHAEARLDGQGYAGAALFVERAGGAGVVHASGAAEDDGVRVLKVVALPSHDRISVAFALSGEPKTAAMRVLSDRAIELEIGPIGRGVTREVLAPPPGAPIVREVIVAPYAAADGESFLRARLLLREPAAGNVRIVGRVVYVDLASGPQSSFPTLADVTPLPRRQAAPQPPADYHAVVRRALARLDEIGPFLQSAVAAPTPDVLAAVAGTVGEVDAVLRSVRAPSASASINDLLVAAVATARQAVAPGFRGDRVREVAQALALVEAARREAGASGGS